MMQKQSIALKVLAALAVLYTLYFAQAILIPITIAVLLQLLLSPAVRWFSRYYVPKFVSAAVLLATILTALVMTGSFLLEPAKEWLQEAPTNLRQLTREIEDLKAPLQEIKELEAEVSEITQLQDERSKPQQVEIRNPKLFDKIMMGVPAFLASLLITFLTALFLLASGDRLSHRIVGFGRTWPARQAIIKALRGVQAETSSYLRTVTLINIGLGFATAFCLWWMDVPNPELWGVMVALLNFAPYAGAIVSTVILFVVGIATFDTLAQAATVPGVFVVLTTLEGAILTPLILGRRMSLDPLVVLLSVVAWGWIWGIPGALIAVPLMSSVRVVMLQFDATRPIAQLMENRRPTKAHHAIPGQRRARPSQASP
ncbi:MAG: AI-2E family transporter [Xanthomonadales bacterium]|nr:AI-2E family transporter [Xanthomonadales bacterium]